MNEELFYQNGKILVEVVQLFQEYRIIGSKDLQMLGDLFEQLLNKGFKQNEGQFFTPTPITRFIWDYALVYLQNTLVITAPDGNKEQEEFLRYKWSNRKGQEGIQIITPGGLLCNVTDRSDDGVLAGIIRNAYVGNACAVPELSDYYYYLRLLDISCLMSDSCLFLKMVLIYLQEKHP